MRLPFTRLSSSLVVLLAAGILASAPSAFAEEAPAAGGEGSGIDCSDPACAELCAKAKEGMEAQLRLTSSTVKPAESVASPQKSCFDSITSQVPQDLAPPTIKGDDLLQGILQQACDKANELMSSITSRLGELGSLSNLDIGNLGTSGLSGIFGDNPLGDVMNSGSLNQGSLTDWLQNSVASRIPNISFNPQPAQGQSSQGAASPAPAQTPTIRPNRLAPQSQQGTGVTPAGGGQQPTQQNDLINLFR